MQKWPEAPFIRYLGVGNSEVLLPNSPSVYKEVLQTQCYSFRKPDWFMRMLKDVIGVGLVSLDGDSHKLHRKMLNVPFAFSNIRKLEPLFQEKARGIGSVFDSAISDGDDGGATGVIECTETFSKATLDIMGVAMLGKELSHLNTVRYTGKDTTKAGADEYSFAEAYNVFFSPGPVGKLLTYFNGFFPLRWLPLAANREYKYASWQAAQDLIIGGHRIPKGTCIDVAPSMIMLNPLIWGRDSQQIDPDRWNHLTTEQSNPYVYGAFSNGPRICIGKAFAMMEMKIILIELVRNYRFLSVEKSYTVENPNLTLRPAGLEIRLERIKQ
ncbi:hypothetical protein KJ359_000196 [Pestalotiopsis sp. 9143b]|nr:hypothetical protein KJ359_000196 [Pestalotiopsis sp. 9143b]